MSRLAIIAIILGACSSSVTSQASAVFRAIEFADSAASIISGLQRILEGDNSNSHTTDEFDEFVNEMNENINTVRTEILNQILLSRKYDKIEDTVISIHGLMVDLRQLMMSNCTRLYRENVKIFTERFDNSDVIRLIYWLPEFLTYRTPGDQNNFLETFASVSRCNATAFDEFKTFYYHLLSEGISLQFVWRTLHDFTLEQKRLFWTNQLEMLEKEFHSQNIKCEKQLPTLALEDLQNSQDATVLYKQNNERYRKQSDVMFFSQKGTHQFTYIEDVSDDFVLQKDGFSYKISIFYTAELKSAWNSNEISEVLFAQLPRIHDVIEKNSVQTASQIAGVVKSILHESNAPANVGSVVVFFKDQFENPKTIISPDSPVASVVIKDVQLEYCHETGIECVLDFVFHSKGNANGEFHVYIYPNDTSMQDKSEISGAERISIGLSLDLMIVMLVCCFFY